MMKMPKWEILPKTIVLIFISLVGLIGNLSIIIIITKNKLLRLQATNLFLLNMACADFLTLLFVPVLYYFKQKVIFKMYYLGEWPCRITPFLIVTFFLSGSLSLMVISLNRVSGIVFPNVFWLQLRRKTVIITLIAIWIVSIVFAGPTMTYRRYWVREWKDLIETNCDDEPDQDQDKCKFKSSYVSYWLSVLAINVWIPTAVMFLSYAFIFVKLRRSIKALPYLSETSRLSRSRRNVIKMLFLLFIVQVLCWFPWQFYTCFDAYQWFTEEKAKVCGDSQEMPVMSGLNEKWLQVEPVIHDIKFFFIFTNSAINPLIYGYCNEMMRKAFRITFTCFFKEQPQYVLRRGAGIGTSKVQFSKLKSGLGQSQRFLKLAAPISTNKLKKEKHQTNGSGSHDDSGFCSNPKKQQHHILKRGFKLDWKVDFKLELTVLNHQRSCSCRQDRNKDAPMKRRNSDPGTYLHLN